MPDIDVIIPAYNAASTILETIASVRAQTLQAARIIVVDDGSTDETVEVVRRSSLPVELLLRRNGGQGDARAAGLSNSAADFVLFLDADDLLLPDALERLATSLSLTDAVLAYCRASPFTCSGETIDESAFDLDDAEGDVFDKLLSGNFIRTTGCVLVRRAEIDAVGGWRRERIYLGNEDWELWMRLASRGRFLRLAEKLLLYRVQQNSFSKDQLRNMASLAWASLALKRFFEKRSPRYPAVNSLYRRMFPALIKCQGRMAIRHLRAGRPISAAREIAKLTQLCRISFAPTLGATKISV